MALLRMSVPEDSALDSTSTDTITNPAAENDLGCRSPGKKASKGKEARTKPKEASVAETLGKHTTTATDRIALEINAGGSASVKKGTRTSTRTGTNERSGRTPATDTHPPSSSAHPGNVNPPSGNFAYFALCPLPLSLVPVSPGLHPPPVNIDYSYNVTTYESYNNHGVHMTNHGSNTTYTHRNMYPSPQIHGVYFEVISRIVPHLRRLP